MNDGSNTLQKTTVRPLTSHLENHPSKTNNTCRILQGKPGGTHKRHSSKEPEHKNLFIRALCGHRKTYRERWMIGRKGYRERERERERDWLTDRDREIKCVCVCVCVCVWQGWESMLSVRLDDDNIFEKVEFVNRVALGNCHLQNNDLMG